MSRDVSHTVNGIVVPLGSVPLTLPLAVHMDQNAMHVMIVILPVPTRINVSSTCILNFEDAAGIIV